jgi:hypothetical protein
LALLKVNIQKRHIIGHNLGIMDERFADQSRDARVGETVHLVGEDIRQFAALAQRVVDNLDAWLAGSASVELPISTPGTVEGDTSMTGQHVGADLGLSPLAVRVATWVVNQSGDGLPAPVNSDALPTAMSDVDIRQLAEAIAELELDGHLTTSGAIGSSLPRICATPDIFATFDPIAGLGDPVADSLGLTERVLAGEDSVDVPALHQQTGWPIRRFNPAAALIVAQVDERRVRQVQQNEYPTLGFHLMAEDRVALKRYAANLRGRV